MERSRLPGAGEVGEVGEGQRGAAAGRAERKSDRASARPGGPESLVGAVLSGRYRIERLIGEGGMGAVYQAEHTHMRKRLAIKVLHPEMSRLPEVVARFEREAMAAGHMDHPNVAGATDFGKLDDGSFFLVLEYVEGRSLREVIACGRLELGQALHVSRQIASALARAHSLGIVHRDLKPENIMLVRRDDDADFVKVLDFGIAKVPIGELVGEARWPMQEQALTQLGMVYGTPEYMAPEQALGQPVDARADLYALGVMTFEMIAGARPFAHESKVTLLGMHVTAPIPRLAERAPDADVPPEVEAIVTRLLAKDAAERFADARQLIDVLDEVTVQLTASGRIPAPLAVSGLGQPCASSPRGSQPDAASVPSVSLGPTRWAGGTPGPAVLRRVMAGRLRAALDAAPVWVKSRRSAVVVLAMMGIVFGGVVVAGRGLGRTVPGGLAQTGNGDPTAATGQPSRPPDTKADAVISSARATIERGDFATAIDLLSALEKKDPDRADVHRLLERAFTGVRNPREAVRESRLWLGADANAAADLKLQEDVRNAALLKESQEDAFALLESKMGSRGIDILYEMAFGASSRLYPQAAARAKHSLEVPDVRGRASPALAVLLDFRDARTCEDRHALLERARDQGDARILTVLQPFASPRGCGFLGRSDCYPCMRKDRMIGEAASAVEDRARRERGSVTAPAGP